MTGDKKPMSMHNICKTYDISTDVGDLLEIVPVTRFFGGDKNYLRK